MFEERMAHAARTLCLRELRTSAMSLASLWEKEGRLRKRFRGLGSFLRFPEVPAEEGDDKEKKSSKMNPINTKSLQLNATAIRVMVDHYQVLSGKQFPIQGLEKEAP